MPPLTKPSPFVSSSKVSPFGSCVVYTAGSVLSAATQLGHVRRRLAGYIAAAEVTPDGRALRFHLARPAELRAFAYGKTVVLDLVQPDPAAGGKASPVRVRSGRHPGFSRIVFDWTRFVDYRVLRDGEQARVIFSRSDPIDLSRLEAEPPRFVRWVKSTIEGKRATVTFGLASDARLRSFRQGTKIVIDVLGNLTERGRKSAPASRQIPAAPGIPVPPPAQAEAPLRAEALGVPRRLEPPARQERREAGDAEPSPLADGVAGTLPEKAAAAGATPSEGRAGSKTLKIDVLRTPAGTRLSFAWPTPVAAAVFRRSGYLWVVFDQPARPDLSAVVPDAGGAVIAADQVPNRRATLLRFRLQPGLFPAVLRRNTTWFVDLSNEAAEVADAIEVRPQPHAAMGARLFLPVIDLGERIEVTDPEVGDRLVVVPVAAPERAVAVERDFLELKVLATAHGVAVAPKADEIEVRLLRHGVVVTKDAGLMLSGGGGRPARAGTLSILEGDRARRLLLRFADWRRGPPERFIEVKHQLLRQIADAPAAERNEHRLRLAQFYFAHGFAADAKGVIAAIEEHDPRVLSEPGFRVMRGAINYLLNRLDQAAEDLFHRDFDGNPEIAAWRGAVAASNKDWETANESFALGAGAVGSYPKELRIRFLLLDAHTALATNRLEQLDSTLTVLVATDPPEEVRIEATHLRGQAQERLGQLDAALESYGTAAASLHRPIRARAEFARVNLLLKKGEITPKQAARRLGRLRFAWRGDDFELELLQRLGELHIGMGDFREGLDTFRQAVTYFPKDATTRLIAQEMNALFERVFLGGAADTMTPVSALGLYYEFRELTPLGAKGDEMIRRLADRLVAVDLLNRAAKLLEHQIKYRLKGGEKARVSVRLAVIYLLDKRAGEALRTLSETRWTPLARGLADERRRLEARAVADVGRYPEALALLDGDEATDAELLRGEIHWRARDWGRAAHTFEALLGDRWQRDAPLNAAERQQLMQLAVSLALAGDQAGLDRVRQRYAARLAKGADADAFRVITGTVERSTTEFRKLAGRIAEVDNLQAFMASYRSKLASGGLSTIN